MDGSKDHLIYDSGEEDDPFEGFTEDEMKEIEEIAANQVGKTTEDSESETEWEDCDSYEDPDSPGD
jgi:hypothetical protein